MLSDIENLLQLQEADRETRRLNDEVAALPKRVAAIEAKLAGTKASLEKAKAAIKADVQIVLGQMVPNGRGYHRCTAIAAVATVPTRAAP